MESIELDLDLMFHSPWVYMVRILQAPEFHWHFAQGIKAIQSKLYIPGVSSILAGIEASIRSTLYWLKTSEFPLKGDLGPVLSNSLLRKAHEQGLPVELLAFPEEANFIAMLATSKPQVKIVKIRNDLAHGNIQAFIDRELGDDLAIFTPECLRSLAYQLQDLSFVWAIGLAQFRSASKA